MSSTNRGGKRSEADYYSTPSWCVHRLVEELDLPPERWLEPCAGNGAIIRAVGRDDVQWTAWERAKECPALTAAVPEERISIGDFVAAHRRGDIQGDRFSVAITNPPFNLAMEFIEACREHADVVVMLLRLNFLASHERWPFMHGNMPDVFVLPNRPAFIRKKGRWATDSIEYAWFVWRREQRGSGRVTVLGLTPSDERLPKVGNPPKTRKSIPDR